MKGVKNDFELNKAEHLANKRRRFSCQFNNARENHCVAAKVVSALINLVDWRENVEPDINARKGQKATHRHSNPHLVDQLRPQAFVSLCR